MQQTLTIARELRAAGRWLEVTPTPNPKRWIEVTPTPNPNPNPKAHTLEESAHTVERLLAEEVLVTQHTARATESVERSTMGMHREGKAR